MGKLNPILVAGAGALVLGMILYIVGTATTEWSEKGDYRAGLFESCFQSHCGKYGDGGRRDATSAMKATQALIIMGLLVAIGALGATGAMILLPILGKDQIAILPLVAAGAGGVCLLFTTIGVIVWAEKVNEGKFEGVLDLGYSFALTIVGGILVAIGGGLAFVGGKQPV